MFKNYLKQIGLERLVDRVDQYILNDFVAEAFATDFPDLSEEEVKKLYVYDVPKVSADGSCSIIEEKAEKPYNLAETFGIFSHPELVSGSLDSRLRGNDKVDWKALRKHTQTIRLWRLGKIVEKIYASSQVDWFGIYRKVQKLDSRLSAKGGSASGGHGNDNDGNSVLVKESYKGLFSRAEFPLTKEFAKKSNNATVGLSGKVVVIQDVQSHTGAYYECDGKVQSEFCLPILSPLSSRATARDLDEISHSVRNDKREVIGIIDAEAFSKNHYTDERLLQIAKVAYDLGQKNLGV